jgi:hypothetical protein
MTTCPAPPASGHQRLSRKVSSAGTRSIAGRAPAQPGGPECPRCTRTPRSGTARPGLNRNWHPHSLPVATYWRADGPSVATIPAVMGDGLKPLTTR